LQTAITSFHSSIRVLEDWEEIDKQLYENICGLNKKIQHMESTKMEIEAKIINSSHEVRQSPLYERELMVREELRTVKFNIDSTEKEVGTVKHIIHRNQNSSYTIIIYRAPPFNVSQSVAIFQC